MQHSPQVLSEAFVFTISVLDATTVEALFTISNWSEAGSNRYKKEQRTQTQWRDLLQDLEGVCL